MCTNQREEWLFQGCRILGRLGAWVTKFCAEASDTITPVKLATCHSWSHFCGTGEFLWYYTYHNLAVCVSCMLATASHLVLHLVCVFNLPVLADGKSHIFYVMLYMGQNPCSLADLSVAHLTSILSPQIWTFDWNFLVKTFITLPQIPNH
jgi:hypothetical protein